MKCINCESSNLKNLGMRFTGKEKGKGYECKDCGNSFIIPISEEEEGEMEVNLTYVREESYLDEIKNSNRIVVVSVMNNSEVDNIFFNSLVKYCKERKAKLIAIPLRYRNPSLIDVLEGHEDTWYDSKIIPYLVENNLTIWGNLRILGALKTQATVENPLSGVDGLSKGNSVIIGHPQVALRTLPRNSAKYPAIAMTTGALTLKNYSDTKAGYKASFNHSMSALLVEYDGEDYFPRHLNFNGTGFYDLDRYYDENGGRIHKERILGLVTGDEHAMFACPEVKEATYGKKDSICSVLNPHNIVRHDVLDFFSGSHHHRNNVFLKFAKFHSGTDSIEDELKLTIEYVNSTTPKDTTNIMVASNHNEHLYRWLNEADPKYDPKNALLYHKLMYLMLERTKMENNKFHCPEPFELYAKEFMPSTIFLSRDETYKIGEVDISNHGDKGISGSRGSSKQYSNIPQKTITAHTHMPVIDKGNYTVGTSSNLRLEYNSGLSCWDSSHVIVQPDSKRQMIFIRNGKWRVK